MNNLAEALAATIDAELDEHGYEDDDEKRGQVAWHFAEAVLTALGLERESQTRVPIPVPLFDADGRPIMCPDCVQPKQQNTFDWIDRERWVTAWKETDRITGEQMKARCDEYAAEVAARFT